MGYEPIEDYGLIGNMRTVALVSLRGSIDWFCCPHFDSPSVFAALLDDKKGGHFQISALGEDVRNRQLYWPDTNVLITRFLAAEGVGEIEDFMPVGTSAGTQRQHSIIRRVNVARGAVMLELVCDPVFDYARVPPVVHVASGGAVFESPGLTLALHSTVPLTKTERGVTARFLLREGESAVFMLRPSRPGASLGICPSGEIAEALFEDTVAFWRHWLAKGTYRGRWREIVNRSALVLKLLTFEPTGAIVAAPTCSLPEQLGGVRNWDYRYTWIRDAAFTLYALLRIGYTDEATGFMEWLDARLVEAEYDPPLQIVYGIDGRRDLTEVTLDHLSGYEGSRPVRIGNGAYEQLQLDVYGELMDAVYLHNKHAVPVSYERWTHMRRILNWVSDNWQRDDEGIWETRGGRRPFVYSKLMCWVALDRGLRLAEKRSFPGDDRRWKTQRDAIYELIMMQGWSARRQAFAQYCGSDRLDASNLLMPMVFFASPIEPKMLQTIAAICRSPREGGLLTDGLLYRYDPEKTEDGLTGREGTFNMCSFWLIEALTRAGRSDPRSLDRARLLFERMLGHANRLGLYAEQTGEAGGALGNYPQALTHLALISAAFNLDRALSGSR